MPSRFLAQQESLASSSTIESEAHLAKARIAAYYARRGEEDRAKAAIGSIRALPREVMGAPLLSLINFAEGLLHFKAGDVARGLEKWSRARAISLSCGHTEGMSLASAWLAFAAYQAEEVGDMAEHVRFALAHGLAECPQAVSRTALTIGLSFHYCNEYEKARQNYLRCHGAATQCGDEIEISALIHDTAAMAIHVKRCSEFNRADVDGGPSVISTKLESVFSYEELVGVNSLPSLSPILLAQEKVLERQWADAIELIDKNLQRSGADGYARLVPGLLADRAYCRKMLGEPNAAVADIELSQRTVCSAKLHRDDTALLYSRLSQVHGLCGNSSQAADFAVRAAAAWKEVKVFKQRLLAVSTELDGALAG